MDNDRKIDLVSVPKKSFWKLSLPILGFCLFDAIYGIVDMLWVSQLNEAALFALGISIPITTLISSFGDSIGQGTNSLMSRYIGSNHYKNAYNTLIHGIILSVILWLFNVSLLFFDDDLLSLMNITQETDLILRYLTPMLLLSFVFIFMNLFSETFQAEGDSKTPTILIIGSNILNLLLDPIFIFYFGWGVEGAAYATILSALIVFVILLYFYLAGKTKVPLNLKYFKPHAYMFDEILKVALPNFLDNALWCISMLFINETLVNSLGVIGPILYSVSNKIKTLLIAPTRAFGRGLMSVTGHLFGARKFHELEVMYHYVLNAAVIVSILVMIVFFIFRNQVYEAFSVFGMEMSIFWIAILGFFIMVGTSFSMIASKMLDGFGKSPYSLGLTALKIAFDIFIISILNMYFSMGSGVLVGITITEILFAAIYFKFLHYLFKRFKDNYEGKETVKSFD